MLEAAVKYCLQCWIRSGFFFVCTISVVPPARFSYPIGLLVVSWRLDFINVCSLTNIFAIQLDLPSRSSSFVIIPASESLDDILEFDIREQSIASSDCTFSRFFVFELRLGFGDRISQSVDLSRHDLFRFPHLRRRRNITLVLHQIYDRRSQFQAFLITIWSRIYFRSRF